MAYAYDGIWTIAFAIHKVLRAYEASQRRLLNPDEVGLTLSNGDWLNRLKEALNQTNFHGLTVSCLKNSKNLAVQISSKIIN